MKVYADILQQSPEWYEIKHGKVGGSKLEKVMANRDKPIRENPFYAELLSSRFEPFEYEDSFMSSDMERGNMYEPLARHEFERIKNVEVEQVGWIEHESGIYGISPDGLLKNRTQAIEIKSPSRITHMKYILNPMSMVEQYVWQVVDYFLTIGIEKLYFISYRPENRIKPLLIQEVTNETVISISKKEKYSVSELVIMAKNRLSELEIALKSDIKKYEHQILF